MPTTIYTKIMHSTTLPPVMSWFRIRLEAQVGGPNACTFGTDQTMCERLLRLTELIVVCSAMRRWTDTLPKEWAEMWKVLRERFLHAAGTRENPAPIRCTCLMTYHWLQCLAVLPPALIPHYQIRCLLSVRVRAFLVTPSLLSTTPVQHCELSENADNTSQVAKDKSVHVDLFAPSLSRRDRGPASQWKAG